MLVNIHHATSLTVAQRTEQERLTIILRDKYNSSSLTKHTKNSNQVNFIHQAPVLGKSISVNRGLDSVPESTINTNQVINQGLNLQLFSRFEVRDYIRNFAMLLASS